LGARMVTMEVEVVGGGLKSLKDLQIPTYLLPTNKYT
jgi:hypothetical protein